MKSRTLTTQQDLEKLSKDVLSLGGYLPLVCTMTQGTKIRSDSQNKWHWSNIEAFMSQIKEAIDKVSDHTGYTPLETMKIISFTMPPQHIEILYARTKEAVHNSLKAIVNIPTSTRLGTAEFSKFDDLLEATIAEIIGEINDVVRRAL